MVARITSLFGPKGDSQAARTAPLRLVVGLNRVDQIVSGGWDRRLNQPTEEAARQIQRKCQDTIKNLALRTDVGTNHIEYYSALKRYRLHNLLNRVVEHCFGGFKLGDVQPKYFEDVDGVDPDVREFTKQERERRAAARGSGRPSASDTLLSELSRHLSAQDLRSLQEKFSAEVKRPPKVAVLGQAGVGKTTTVNSLFATQWATNPMEVGTHTAQAETVRLPSGAWIEMTDLPGYGRSIKEDARYERIYQDVIPDCDLVLLIVQADRGDLADDIEMIAKLNGWLSQSPTPNR